MPCLMVSCLQAPVLVIAGCSGYDPVSPREANFFLILVLGELPFSMLVPSYLKSPFHLAVYLKERLVLNWSVSFCQGSNVIAIDVQIEVVPFFHNMAEAIVNIVGEDKPDAVIATTIVFYSISVMATGLVFYLMGRFKVGYRVRFIPRYILIGCIGGIGWFLVATGFEVSACLDSSVEYNLDLSNKLTDTELIPP